MITFALIFTGFAAWGFGYLFGVSQAPRAWFEKPNQDPHTTAKASRSHLKAIK